MLAHLAALIVAPLVLASGADPAGRSESDYGGQELEALYRHVGSGREQATLTVRYATSRAIEVGWRVGLRQFRDDDALVTGRQVAIGPLWGIVAGRRGRAAILRIELNPWFTVGSSLKDPAFTDPAVSNKIKMPFGADASVLLSAPIRLGKGMRIAPGAGYTVTVARTTGPVLVASADPTVGQISGTQATWDWLSGWRAALPVWLGTQQRFRMEFGYTRPEHDGKYLLLTRERWDASLAWRF
jgi:hypothetical protein